MVRAHPDLAPRLRRAGDLLETGDLLRLTLRRRTGEGLLLRLSFRLSAGDLLLAGESSGLALLASLSGPASALRAESAWPLARAGFEAAVSSARSAAPRLPCRWAPCSWAAGVPSAPAVAVPLSWGVAAGSLALAAGLAVALFMPSRSAAILALGVSGFAELLSALVADLSLCLSFLSESGAALFLDLSAERLRDCLFLSLSLSLPRSLSFSRPLCLSFSLLLTLSLSASLARSLSLLSRDLQNESCSYTLSFATLTPQAANFFSHGCTAVMTALPICSRVLAATMDRDILHDIYLLSQAAVIECECTP